LRYDGFGSQLTELRASSAARAPDSAAGLRGELNYVVPDSVPAPDFAPKASTVTVRQPYSPTVRLTPFVDDDGDPEPDRLSAQWQQNAGPPGVTFAPADAFLTEATFPAPGEYQLKLRVSDGQLSDTRFARVSLYDPARTPELHETECRHEGMAKGFVSQTVHCKGDAAETWVRLEDSRTSLSAEARLPAPPQRL
jgi:hypothetical protein